MTNPRARKILFDTYWSPAGWNKKPSTPPDDLAYAIAAGYMFEPRVYTHDAVVDWLVTHLKTLVLGDITNAFLASLSTRRLELRSTLGSYAAGLNLPRHKMSGSVCPICGDVRAENKTADLSLLNFERYKWGGVRHTQIEYIALDITQFERQEKVLPVEEDFAIMRKILDVIRECEPDARPRDLEKRFCTVFDSNKAEREQLIEILSYCGILQPKTHPGYFQAFVNFSDRKMPPASKLDWTYPICWWHGSDGVDAEALGHYFPQFA